MPSFRKSTSAVLRKKAWIFTGDGYAFGRWLSIPAASLLAAVAGRWISIAGAQDYGTVVVGLIQCLICPVAFVSAGAMTAPGHRTTVSVMLAVAYACFAVYIVVSSSEPIGVYRIIAAMLSVSSAALGIFATREHGGGSEFVDL